MALSGRRRAGCKPLPDHFRDGDVGPGRTAVWLSNDDGQPGVRTLADGEFQRNLAEKRHAELVCLGPCSAVRKNVVSCLKYTRKMPAYPFLRPAFEANKDVALTMILNGLKAGLEIEGRNLSWGTPP